MISIYSDGSSGAGGGKPGGYGWLIVRGDKIIAWGYGGSPSTTNNLMEMEGAIQGMEAAIELGLHTDPELIELVSDSQYTLGMATGAMSPSKNLEVVERLKALYMQVVKRARWVRGHTGEKYNEQCDELAKQGKDENTSPAVLAKRAAKRKK